VPIRRFDFITVEATDDVVFAWRIQLAFKYVVAITSSDSHVPNLDLIKLPRTSPDLQEWLLRAAG